MIWPSHSPLGPGSRAIRHFQEWAREDAVPLDDERRVGQALDGLLAERRIVYLGEANHFVHEKYLYRMALLRPLHARGFRCLGEELAWSDGRRLDRYLESGDDRELGRVSTWGYRGAERPDRDDRPTGVLADGADHYPDAAFRAEHVRFASALRALGGVRFFGFDVDYLPALGYEELAGLLPPRGSDTDADALRDALARVPGESLDEEIRRLRRACAAHPGAGEVARALRTLETSFAYVRDAHPAPNLKALAAPMALREQAMLEHALHVLEREGADARLVLMGHNQHLAKRDDRLPAGGGGAPGGGRVPSLGTALARRFPGEVAAVWMLYAEGCDSQPLRRYGNRAVSPTGSLNAILSEVGPAFLLPTTSADPRAALLRRRLEVRGMCGSRVRARVAEQADAIAFVRRVTPLRESGAGS